MEDNNFFLFITYKGKTVKFKVQNPKGDTLEVLMKKLMNSRIFEMPNVDPSGAPVVYYFGKKDENGKDIILNPRVGKVDCFLRDYNVNNNDSLSVILDPIPGAR